MVAVVLVMVVRQEDLAIIELVLNYNIMGATRTGEVVLGGQDTGAPVEGVGQLLNPGLMVVIYRVVTRQIETFFKISNKVPRVFRV